ncbi:unnamed protein product, partial [Thlaspi arvense]
VSEPTDQNSVSPIFRPRVVFARELPPEPTDSVTDYREDIGDVSIFTASGQRVRFSDGIKDDVWNCCTIVLLRHFRCVCCWDLVTALKEAKPRFDAARVKSVNVGVETPDKTRLLATRASVLSRFVKLREATKNYIIKATPEDRSSVLQSSYFFIWEIQSGFSLTRLLLSGHIASSDSAM